MSTVLSIERALQIDGWMSQAELEWLADHASRADVVIEVGSYKGRSTRALGDSCRGKVYAVDPWGRYLKDDGTMYHLNPDLETFKRNVQDLIDAGRVVPVRGLVKDVLDLLEPADLVFLDGDHRYENVLRELGMFGKLLKPKGVLSGHDYGHPSWPGVKQAVDEVFGPEGTKHCGQIWWFE